MRDTDNGFGLTFNFSELEDGPHTITLFIDGEEISTTDFQVLTLGTKFLRDVEGEGTILLSDGKQVTVTWEQSTQNFVITDYRPFDAPHLVFGQAVSVPYRRRVRELMARAMFFAEEETGERNSDFTAFVYVDREAFLDTLQRQLRRSDAQRTHDRRTIIERGENWATVEFTRNGTAIFLYGDFWFASDAQLLRILAHEYFHIIQFTGFRAGQHAPGTEGMYQTGPVWLAEGSAEYVALRAAASEGLFVHNERDFSEVLAWRAEIARAVQAPLSEVETREGFFPTDGVWELSVVALDFLVKNFGGLPALGTYYREIAPGVHWERAFRRAFGLGVEEFYEVFAAHRQQGFPPS